MIKGFSISVDDRVFRAVVGMQRKQSSKAYQQHSAGLPLKVINLRNV